jgi:hypothetical protein
MASPGSRRQHAVAGRLPSDRAANSFESGQLALGIGACFASESPALQSECPAALCRDAREGPYFALLRETPLPYQRRCSTLVLRAAQEQQMSGLTDIWLAAAGNSMASMSDRPPRPMTEPLHTTTGISGIYDNRIIIGTGLSDISDAYRIIDYTG